MLGKFFLLPIQRYGPHQVARLQGQELRRRVFQTYAVPPDLRGGGMEAIRLRATQQDGVARCGGWQIQADQAAATAGWAAPPPG